MNIRSAADILHIVNEVYDSMETNNFASLGHPDMRIWERPLVGVAAGDDQYYKFLKTHIGNFHWTPEEAFSLKYGKADAKSLRVISIIFPHSDETKKLQSGQHKLPCDRWVVSRGEWEIFIKEFASKMEDQLASGGIRSVFPEFLEEMSLVDSPIWGKSSKWSHRHSAFAAGMGTFGLSDGFISERGMAIRLTSIIVEADLEVTPRGDKGHYDWCLYFKSGICGACIRRCPKRAISEKGHNKKVCSSYLEECYSQISGKLDVSNYKEVGCGLCQTKVPCMDKRP